MYGLIEKALMDIVRPFQQCDLFQTSEGDSVLVDQLTFNKVVMVIQDVCQDAGLPPILFPYIVNTDIVGLKTIVHAFWVDMDILHSITTGEEKLRSAYISITNFAATDAGRVLLHEVFAEKFKNAWDRRAGFPRANAQTNAAEALFGDDEVRSSDAIRTSNPASATTTIDYVECEASPEPAPEKAPEPVKTKSEGMIFIEKFHENISPLIPHRVIDKTDDHWVIQYGAMAAIVDDTLMQLSKDLNRNVVIVNERCQHVLKYVRNSNPTEISKHTIILFANPETILGLGLVRASASCDSACYGKDVRPIYAPCQDNNRETLVHEVLKNIKLSTEEKTKAIDEIDKNIRLSQYAKYDAVYKDTFTNVVWALKDRCFLYLLFPISYDSLDAFFRCMFELARRFEGKISSKELKKIDKEYWDEIAGENKRKYIKYAMESAKDFLNELIHERDEYAQKYKAAIDSAMHNGKLEKRLSERIELFNKNDFAEEEKKRITENYEQTLKIPGVAAVKIEDAYVHVYTKNLYCMDERTKKYHDIGTFHITIGMLNSSYDASTTVRVMNTKHLINGYQEKMQAPHVYNDGRMCHGTLFNGMVEAYTKRDLFQLVYQLLLFLQNANVDDVAGRQVDKWPEVPKEIATRPYTLEEEITEEKEKEEINELSKQFDDMFAVSIPVNT